MEVASLPETSVTNQQPIGDDIQWHLYFINNVVKMSNHKIKSCIYYAGIILSNQV
jgi:hypothetical protein